MDEMTVYTTMSVNAAPKDSVKSPALKSDGIPEDKPEEDPAQELEKEVTEEKLEEESEDKIDSAKPEEEEQPEEEQIETADNGAEAVTDVVVEEAENDENTKKVDEAYNDDNDGGKEGLLCSGESCVIS